MKQFKVWLMGITYPQSNGWRTVQAKDENDARDKASKLYPNAEIKEIKRVTHR